MPVRAVAAGELDLATLYAILRLRAAVFVVEQRCAYQDLDERDLEPSTRHCWVEDPGVVAYVRVLSEPGGERCVGRVVTAPSARGRGYAGALVRHALTLAAPAPVVLDAQSYLVEWYGRLGFAVDGPEYVEDGIPHTPMRLA